MPDQPNLKSTLSTYLSQAGIGHVSFPDPSTDYYDRFKRIDEYLNKNVHPHVNKGPAALEPIWLTDHGVKHIETVIIRASTLVNHGQCILTPYESYLLMLSIHFHDIGNIFGRSEHEKKITQIIADLSRENGTLIGDNDLEKRMVRDIALVHGGKVNGSQDTIGNLQYKMSGADPRDPRIHLLAAILRFADEISDDHTRADRWPLQKKVIPPESEIFHVYADRLREVNVKPLDHYVKLRFAIDVEMIEKRFKKYKVKKKIFLFDEICERVLKTYKELVYCNRFMRPVIHINALYVDIGIFTDEYMKQYALFPLELSEQGYPDGPKRLSDICPELRSIKGENFKENVEKQHRRQIRINRAKGT